MYCNHKKRKNYILVLVEPFNKIEVLLYGNKTFCVSLNTPQVATRIIGIYNFFLQLHYFITSRIIITNFEKKKTRNYVLKIWNN